MLEVVRVRREAARLIREKGQLMIYSKWIIGRKRIDAGVLVIVEEEGSGDVLGCGFYDTVGPVAIRLVSLGECSYSDPYEVLVDRIEKSLKTRRMQGYKPSNAFRLVHSDGDLLPGLIIDFYGDLIVYQSSSIVWDIHGKLLIEALRQVFGDDISIYEKSTQRTRLDIGLEPREGLRYGSKSRTIVEEGGIKLIVDPRRGQKTGLFLDQALNRLYVEKIVEPGSKVLDVFAYTGGFGLHALSAGAQEVVFVEQDEKAIELLRENLAINGFRNGYKIIAEDAWKAFRMLRSSNQRFNIVIVDPPAFIPHEEAKEAGMKAYYYAYRHATFMLMRPGILFLSSCSTFLTRSEFEQIIAKVLSEQKLNYHVLMYRGAPPDHPTRPGTPYLDYLKSMFLLVE